MAENLQKIPGKTFSRISGVGMYLPEERITNAQLSEILDYDVENYLKDLQIGVRHRAAPDESTSDMATKAAQAALKNAGLKPEDVDLLIIATDTPDYINPPTCAIVCHKLGAVNAGSFDINAACTDETIALGIGSQYITMDPDVNNVVVVGVYGMTKWLDWSKYSENASKVLSMLFGDGAAAVVLSASDKPGYLASRTATDGSYWDTYGIYVGTANPLTVGMVQDKKHFLRFHENGHRVPKDFNAVRWSKLLAQTAKKAGVSPDQFKLVLMNQVDPYGAKAALSELGLTLDNTHWVADKFGYTGSASAFMALHDAVEQGKLSEGDLVAFCTTGTGFVLGTALFEWR